MVEMSGMSSSMSGVEVDGEVGRVDCPVGFGEVLNVSILILSGDGAVGSAGETGAVWLAGVPCDFRYIYIYSFPDKIHK